jgi:hypothetical protein
MEACSMMPVGSRVDGAVLAAEQQTDGNICSSIRNDRP